MTKEIIEKINRMKEDELTDEEVLQTIDWFRELSGNLRLLGDRLYLAYNKIDHYLADIESEGYSRGIIDPHSNCCTCYRSTIGI